MKNEKILAQTLELIIIELAALKSRIEKLETATEIKPIDIKSAKTKTIKPSPEYAAEIKAAEKPEPTAEQKSARAKKAWATIRARQAAAAVAATTEPTTTEIPGTVGRLTFSDLVSAIKSSGTER